MEKLEKEMFNKILDKIDHLEEMLNKMNVVNAMIKKDIESNSRHIHKAEGAIEIIEKLIDLNKNHISHNSIEVERLYKKQDELSSKVQKVGGVGNINWIKAIDKYIPYIIVVGIVSLLIAESPIRKFLHH